jgi:hypothetical protein
MTPIAAWLAQRVPAALVLPALALIYFAMMFALMLVGGVGTVDIAYVDVGRK